MLGSEGRLALALFCAALLPVNVVAVRSLQESEAPASSSPAPVNIAKLALNLDYLEAECYSCAATGDPLPSSLRGGGASSRESQRANLTSVGQELAEEPANNSMRHVEGLRNALGSQAVAAPLLNIGRAFSEALNALVGAPVSPPYSPYTNDVLFFLEAFMFDHEGLGVESIAGASSAEDDLGLATDTSLSFVPVNDEALVSLEIPAQVLDIATLGKGATGRGSFPNRFNAGLASVSLGGAILSVFSG